jgi:calpain-15
MFGTDSKKSYDDIRQG